MASDQGFERAPECGSGCRYAQFGGMAGVDNECLDACLLLQYRGELEASEVVSDVYDPDA